MSARTFPLRAVLTVTTGVHFAPLTEVQSLLSHMTGTTLAAIQIPRAADVCQKYLRDQFEWLEGLAPTRSEAANEDRRRRWLTTCEARWGRHLTIQVLPGGAYQYMDPIVEFTRSLETGTGAGVVTGG